MQAETKPKLSVIIPTMREADSIKTTLCSFHRGLEAAGIPFELVVVNDVRDDTTAEVLEETLHELPHLVVYNRYGCSGFGSALKEGLKRAEGDYIVFATGDGRCVVDDIATYYKALDEGYEAVFGSRFIKGAHVSGYPIFKLILNRLTNTVLRLLFDWRFNDYTGGVKGYRRSVLDRCMPLVSNHFNITIELPLKVLLQGAKIKQVPISLYARESGLSKLRLTKMVRYYLGSLLHVLGLKLIGKEFFNPDRRIVKLENDGNKVVRTEVV